MLIPRETPPLLWITLYCFFPSTAQQNAHEKKRIKICLILCTLNHPFGVNVCVCWMNDVDFSTLCQCDGWILIFRQSNNWGRENNFHLINCPHQWSSSCEWHKKCWYCILLFWLVRTKNSRERWKLASATGQIFLFPPPLGFYVCSWMFAERFGWY